jgi:hypothetical protein
MTGHVPEPGKRLKIVWQEGEPTFDEPMLDPMLVGTISAQDEDGRAGEPWVMTVTIDIDEIPRLREAFERTVAGEELDVVSQWHTSVPPSETESPTAFLFLQFPQLDLRFRIRFIVDKFRRSLATAARTGNVMLLEPELNKSMRIDRPDEALRSHLQLGLPVRNVEALRSVLRQRFDLPFPEPERQEAKVIEQSHVVSEFERFVLGASLESPPLAIHVPADDFTTFVVLAPDSAEAMTAAGDVDDRWAHWASLRVGPHVVVRLDVLTGNSRLAAWVFAEPPGRVIRAASSGPHRIVVVTEAVSIDALSPEVLRRGVEFRVHVPPESMRQLLRWALEREAADEADSESASGGGARKPSG